MKRIHLTSLGQIPEADISFGDLTVFVGEQASGKSILLQLVKLILDTSDITRTLKTHGFDWRKEPRAFLPLYFGEGMEGIWNSATQIAVDDAEFSLDKALSRKGRKKAELLFLIPAHRAITLKDGWPRPFTDYAFGDPYVVKRFSEQLRLLMETGLGSGESAIFPQEGRMKQNHSGCNRQKHLCRSAGQIGQIRAASTHCLGRCRQPTAFYGLVYRPTRIYATADGALLVNAFRWREEENRA